jgi:hypothetical protein
VYVDGVDFAGLTRLGCNLPGVSCRTKSLSHG